jgi:hypothetical protein
MISVMMILAVTVGSNRLRHTNAVVITTAFCTNKGGGGDIVCVLCVVFPGVRWGGRTGPAMKIWWAWRVTPK